MADYISSANITVFPSTYRTNYPNGKFTSENNFVNIINSIIDIDKSISKLSSTKGFVVDYNSDTIKFVIHGYYFEAKDVLSAISIPNGGKLYAKIRVTNDSHSLVNYDQSNVSLDNDNGRFTGVSFDTDSVLDTREGTTAYALELAEKIDGKIYIKNRIKFVTDSIQYVDEKKQPQSLTAELNAKQYKLKNGDGIAEIKNEQNEENVIKLTESAWKAIKSISGEDGLKSVGSGTQFVYANKGEIVATTASVGTKASNSNLTSTTMIMSGGNLIPGVSIYASTSTPPADKGSVGDIWLRYE